jgi:hypothetical protein
LRAIDELDALGFGGGDHAVAVRDALKEFPVGLLNAVTHESQSGLP